jgi:hypothetical protein
MAESECARARDVPWGPLDARHVVDRLTQLRLVPPAYVRLTGRASSFAVMKSVENSVISIVNFQHLGVQLAAQDGNQLLSKRLPLRAHTIAAQPLAADQHPWVLDEWRCVPLCRERARKTCAHAAPTLRPEVPADEAAIKREG